MKPALLAAGLILAGCGTQPPATKVRIAIVAQTLSHLPTYVASRLGYFTAEGLDVTLEELPGSSKGLEALIGGSVEVAAGYYDLTLQMAAEGRQIQSFLVIANSPLVVLAVAPGSSLARIEDLRGKLVGVTTLGSNVHHLLNYLLITHGLTPADVTPVAIGPGPRALAAMEQRRVEAAVISDLNALRLEQRHGKVTILADTRTPEGLQRIYGIASYPSAVLCATRTWITRHPELARKLARAVLRAMEWCKTHTAEEILPYVPSGDDPKLYAAAIRTAVSILSADGRLRAEEAGTIQGVEAALNGKLRAVDLSATYTNDLLPHTR